MRPLKLEIEGFTSFRDHLELDLSSLDLFAITGPTGAGKSSLIDAICYALYGRVPRVANEVKECIALGMPRMYVALEFQAAGGDYRVFREAKRTGQPNVRLERCVDSDWQALAHGATEVTKRVEGVVGLTYDAFTRSVLLPQGQFQEFLSGSPDKRRDVLQSLLRLDVYKRMQARANEIAGSYRQKADSIEHELREFLGDATPGNLEQQKENRELAKSEAESLAGRMECWRSALEQAKAYAALLEAFRKARDEKNKTAAELESANSLLAAGGGEIEALEKVLAEVDAVLEMNEYDDELFAALSAAATIAAALETTRKRLAETDQEAKSAQAACDAAVKAAAAAAEKLASAVEATHAAEQALDQAQHRNLSAAVQAGLQAGDTCPVCGGKVGKLPPIEAADLDGARAESEAAKERQARAQSDVTKAEAARAGAEERSVGAMARMEQYRAQVEADEERLATALPAGAPASLAALQTQLQAQKEAREERLRLTRQRDQARTALESATRGLAEARERVAGLQMLLDTQEAALKAATDATSEAHSSLKARAADDGLDAITQALDQRRDAVGAAESELRTLSERTEAVQKDIGRLDGLIDKLKDDIEKAGQLRKALVDVKAGQEMAGDLSQMLMANRFQAFMQAEALRLLAVEGSKRLEQLSNGRYRLDISANGQDFEAIDQWNADDKRSVRTLSGGETFLASLALSLALAESLPGLAPDGRVALDAVFLDEGFGSLDPEALDRAAEALDSLRDGTRMVCVVTHLQELAQRMPARIVVQKEETGSRASIAT